MASDYARADPAKAFAERRGIAFRERVVEIVRKIERGLEKWAPVFQQDRRPASAPEKVRGMFDELRLHSARADVPQPAAPERKVVDDPEAELRRARTRAFIRHARGVDDIFAAQDAGEWWSPAQACELNAARDAFEEVRPHGWRDAEAAYKKNPELALEAGSGQVRRAVQALQLETELRTDPQRRADRFVARWQKLDQTSQRQYQAGDISDHKTTHSFMGNMAKSLERDPQLESILANRKLELGISFDTGRSLSRELAFNHGIDLGRGRGIGI